VGLNNKLLPLWINIARVLHPVVVPAPLSSVLSDRENQS